MINHKRIMSVAGHRGDSYNYFENTMTAFEAAYKAGADMIETDVDITSVLSNSLENAIHAVLPLPPEKLRRVLARLTAHFESVRLLMDC